VTSVAAISPADSIGSVLGEARQRTNAPSSAAMTASAFPRSPSRSVRASVHWAKTVAVARRRRSSVLAASSAMVAIGQASS
jgi:hypothetical protein